MVSPFRPRSAALIALMLMLGAGCELLPGNDLASFENNRGGEAAPEDDGAAGATPGCRADLVTEGAEICATCDFAAEPICGVPETAVCEARQNADGDPCKLCQTDAGVVLYDDCFLNASAGVDAARCEASPGANDAEACSTCFDSFGSVVSSTCAPASDGCEGFVASDGRSCTRCGAVTVCDAVDLDPDFCRAYENAAGRCVDCFDAELGMISHACTPANGSARICEERVQPEGLVCTVCYDGGGLVVEQSCREALPQLERCEQLTFAEQVCTVCVDGQDNPTFVDCTSTTCEAPTDAIATCRSDADCSSTEVCFNGSCEARRGEDPAPPPAVEGDGGCEAPACTMSRGDDGALCRTCTTTGGTTETRCLSAAVLSCEVLPESELPAPSDGRVDEDFTNDAEAAPPADPQGRLCVLCRDREAGVEVYRDCDGNGAVPPPSCSEVVDAAGGTCTACFDAVTGDAVFTTCGEASCYDRSDRPLLDLQGVPLAVDGSDAIATCEQCAVTIDGAVRDDVTCRLPARCGDALFADASTCGGTTLKLQPRRCENPWEPWRAGLSRSDDVAGLLAFSLERHGLVVQAATSVETPATATCSDGCACPRDDIIELVVIDADVDAARAAFGSLLVP